MQSNEVTLMELSDEDLPLVSGGYYLSWSCPFWRYGARGQYGRVYYWRHYSYRWP